MEPNPGFLAVCINETLTFLIPFFHQQEYNCLKRRDLVFEIYNLFTSRIFNISILNIPFFRNVPVKNLRTTVNLIYLNRNKFLEDLECFTDTISSNASADWIQPFY